MKNIPMHPSKQIIDLLRSNYIYIQCDFLIETDDCTRYFTKIKYEYIKLIFCDYEVGVNVLNSMTNDCGSVLCIDFLWAFDLVDPVHLAHRTCQITSRFNQLYGSICFYQHKVHINLPFSSLQHFFPFYPSLSFSLPSCLDPGVSCFDHE